MVCAKTNETGTAPTSVSADKVGASVSTPEGASVVGWAVGSPLDGGLGELVDGTNEGGPDSNGLGMPVDGTYEGGAEGPADGDQLGRAVGVCEGASDGFGVGKSDGVKLGRIEGDRVKLGRIEGAGVVGISVGHAVGAREGVAVGTVGSAAGGKLAKEAAETPSDAAVTPSTATPPRTIPLEAWLLSDPSARAGMVTRSTTLPPDAEIVTSLALMPNFDASSLRSKVIVSPVIWLISASIVTRSWTETVSLALTVLLFGVTEGLGWATVVGARGGAAADG